MHYSSPMDNIDDTYALLGLTEEIRDRLVNLANLGRPSTAELSRVVVETVVIEDGARKVIEREERSA